MIPNIIILSDRAYEVASKIKQEIGGTIQGLEGRCSKSDSSFSDVRSHLQSCFKSGEPIVAVMASGAIIRLLANVLEDKYSEPPVLAIAEDASSVVPLLGGHHGANELAKQLADILQSHAAITTAGDLRFGLALDNPPEGWTLVNPENAKPVMAALLGGEEVRLQGRYLNAAKWLMESNLPLDDDGECVISIAELEREYLPLELMFHPKRHVIGIGCERDTSPQEVIDLVEQVLRENEIPKTCVAGIASIDLKADETAIQEAAKYLSVPTRFYSAAVLEDETPRLVHPSEVVFAEVGCHGVSEGAALASVGSDGELIVPKVKSKKATVAIARSQEIVDMSELGRAQGRLFVVGIGPGQEAWRSPEVTRMVQEATDLVGYSLYLDIISEISEGKTRHDFDLGKEEDRVRQR